MNKAELIERIVAHVGDVTPADADRVVSGVFDVITDALKAGDPVTLSGFGSFKVSYRAARTGRNPRTGEAIQIAAAKSPVFKAGKRLKTAVNS